MDLDYLLRVVEVAAEYGYNALQICGDTHDQGNLDGITEFVRFPRANELRDMEAVRRRREILRTVCRAAHDRGMEVYYWHHELWFPERSGRSIRSGPSRHLRTASGAICVLTSCPASGPRRRSGGSWTRSSTRPSSNVPSWTAR